MPVNNFPFPLDIKGKRFQINACMFPSIACSLKGNEKEKRKKKKNVFRSELKYCDFFSVCAITQISLKKSCKPRKVGITRLFIQTIKRSHFIK